MLNLLIDPDSPKLARPFEALELGDAVEETIVLDLSAVQAFSRLAGS